MPAPWACPSMVGLLVGTFATGATTAEGRLNVPLGGQSTTRRRYSRGTPSTLRAYPARGIFSSASCTARCCSGRGPRGSRPRFDPRVVICVAPAPAEAGDRPAWVELALGPGRRGSASARAGGSCTTRCPLSQRGLREGALASHHATKRGCTGLRSWAQLPPRGLCTRVRGRGVPRTSASARADIVAFVPSTE